jgi:hypothetical protein
VHKVVQRLPVGSWYNRGEFDERLVVLARQEQPNQVLPQRPSFFESSEQVVEGGTELVDRLGGGWGRLPWSAHRLNSSRADRLLALPVYHT